MMTNGRDGKVHYEESGETVWISGLVNIEETGSITVARVRSHDSEQIIPWSRVVRVEYQ